MTRPDHHLTQGLLMAYSAGTLPEAFNLAVATHLSMCDDCRAEVEGYDVLGGALLEHGAAEDDPAAMDEGSLAATLDRIRSAPATAASSDPAAAEAREGTGASDLPAPLAAYIGGSLADVRWRPVGMGVKQAILPTSREASARLLLIPAGTAMPDHGHHGTELTLVLRGAFLDGGARFGPGDVEIATEALEHTPVADIGEDCICLAVADGKLRFRGLLPRLLQPLLRI
ncbi:transcriptional regulator [Aquicoccus sp. SCR17]|nr:transcriptional regulator [Carideicomes alvinocaridis]